MPSLREGAPQASWDSPLHVMAYPCLTSERPAFAPVVITPQHKVKPGAEIHTARLHLDALCYVRRDTPGALAAYNVSWEDWPAPRWSLCDRSDCPRANLGNS